MKRNHEICFDKASPGSCNFAPDRTANPYVSITKRSGARSILVQSLRAVKGNEKKHGTVSKNQPFQRLVNELRKMYPGDSINFRGEKKGESCQVSCRIYKWSDTFTYTGLTYHQYDTQHWLRSTSSRQRYLVSLLHRARVAISVQESVTLQHATKVSITFYQRHGGKRTIVGVEKT